MKGHELLAANIFQAIPELKPIIRASDKFQRSHRLWLLQKSLLYTGFFTFCMYALAYGLDLFGDNHVLSVAAQGILVFGVLSALILAVAERRIGGWKFIGRKWKFTPARS